ncbi:MAG: CCA tRNA nucleotidyltransferase [Dehalococcoidales bacterium]|nr:CCA tRNA nucleotidyltransferase [Dehalococcoidales bacterium]
MAETKNLSSRIKEYLPSELTGFLEAVGAIAAYQGYHLYLVGGVVRDLLLDRSNLDLDLVVEGDAVALAQQAASVTQGKLTVHRRFGTARLRWGKWSIDFARARSETYDRPGALPRVNPGSLSEDLFRRDFTINAMAINLNPGCYGELIDSYGGRADLEKRLVRVLHEKSFTDDATRIWRALRYEQRLDFQLEADTRRLLARDIPMLDTISSDRVRHELELVLKEAQPEKVLRRAKELKVLSRLHPALKASHTLSARFQRAREVTIPESQLASVYLALLTYPLTDKEMEDFISLLRVPGRSAEVVRDSQRLKTKLKLLATANLAPSRIYTALQGYAPAALLVSAVATDSPAVSRNIGLFYGWLRYVKPSLTGDCLIQMGVAPGPGVREFLERLRAARLDGEIATRQEEREVVTKWLQERG